MATNSKEARQRAESRFEKQQNLSREREKIKTEDEAEAQRVRDNTARLKALRLAKEAAEAANPPVKPKKKTTVAKKKKS